MAVPIGITKKHKDNSKRLFRSRESWLKTKKENRPYQVFDEATGKWRKIMEPSKVTE